MATCKWKFTRWFNPLAPKMMLMIEVYGKQDRLVKKGKQDVLNEEHRQHVQALLKIPE